MRFRDQCRAKFLNAFRSVTLALLLTASGFASAQPSDQAVTGAWTASWISDPKASPTEPGVYHFRKDIDLAARPSTFPIRVSADNRYRLYVNGIEVASGPARGSHFTRAEAPPILFPACSGASMSVSRS